MRLASAILACITYALPLSADSADWQWGTTSFSTNLGGSGYMEAKAAPALAPATLFAAITLGAIIAVVVKNEKDHGQSHAHAHAH